MGRSVIAFCATALVAGACIVNVAFGKSPEVTRSDSVHVQGTALCPNMVVAANGDLIVTFTNKGDVLPPTETIFVRSMDGGKTWSDEYLRYAPDGSNKDDGVSVGGMLTMDDGAILAYRLTIVTPDGELGSAPRKTKVEILRSRDNGATFDVVGILKERQDTLVAPYGPMIKLADGQILMGGFIENVGNGYWLSKDNGDTWGEFNNIWKDPPEGAKRNLWFNETAYIVLPGGKILSVARNDTDKIFYTVESEDNGATWINQRATNIGGGSPALHVMANGTVLLAYRDFTRPGLGVSESVDGGKTWRYLYALPVPKTVAVPPVTDRWIRPADDMAWQPGEGQEGYPSFADLPDGNVYVVWYTVNTAMEGSPSPYSIVGNVISNSKDEPTVNGAAVYPVAQVGTLLRGQKIVGPAAVAQLISKSQGLGLEMTPLRIENRTDREAEMHSAEDDIFYILDGAATFHLGGTLQDTWEYSPGNTAGHKQRNATEYKVAAGDIVVVPRGTAHRITCPDGFVEVLVIKRLADQSSDLAPTPAGKN